MPTIAETYCAAHGLPPHRFGGRLLWRCLTPQARLCYPLLALWPAYFEADLELLRAVGRLPHLGDFSLECAQYRAHPGNRGWLRQTLRLRLSTRRLRAQLERTLLRPAAAAA